MFHFFLVWWPAFFSTWQTLQRKGGSEMLRIGFIGIWFLPLGFSLPPLLQSPQTIVNGGLFWFFALADTFGLYLILAGVLRLEWDTGHFQENQFLWQLWKIFTICLLMSKRLGIFFYFQQIIHRCDPRKGQTRRGVIMVLSGNLKLLLLFSIIYMPASTKAQG